MKLKQQKKELKKRIASILLIYMDGLSEKKKEELSKYLESSLGEMVNYYTTLLKKKDRKQLVLPALPNQSVGIYSSMTGKRKKENTASTESHRG